MQISIYQNLVRFYLHVICKAQYTVVLECVKINVLIVKCAIFYLLRLSIGRIIVRLLWELCNDFLIFQSKESDKLFYLSHHI